MLFDHSLLIYIAVLGVYHGKGNASPISASFEVRDLALPLFNYSKPV